MGDEILITGGAGFLGVGVARRILAERPDARIVLCDLSAHPRVDDLAGRVRLVSADLSDPLQAATVVGPDTGTIFHFASLVSGGAERDFDAGLAANLFATLHLIAACRRHGTVPRFVFPSSIATFGGPALPAEVDDRTHQHPQNSYGVAKVCCEQLISDASRKGFIDGRCVRLPAIVVRDEPNTAVSGYASALVREPLAGRDYRCPVGTGMRIPLLSVGRCVELLTRLAAVPAEQLGSWRAFNAPCVSPTAGELLDAVRRLAGDRRLGAVTFAPEAAIEGMLAGWPRHLHAPTAERLGLRGDAGVDEIVRDYLDSLPSRPAACAS